MQTEPANPRGPVTHPSREEWMGFLYGESPRRAELDAHLKGCAVCQRDVARWRSAMTALDIDKIVVPKRRRALPIWKWAAAAAFIIAALGIGFGFGRTAATNSLRAELAQEKQALANAVANEMQRALATYAEVAEARRIEDQQTVLSAMQTLDAARRADILGLRKDLETVAVMTDDSLRKTEQQLIQLAASSQAAGNQ